MKKTALITGASSGIGEACAKQFARQGYDLVLVARRGERLGALAATLAVNVQVIVADVSDSAVVFSALKDVGPVDVLINNAGLSRRLDALAEGEISDWEQMIDVNVKGLLYVTRAMLPKMIERGCGQIINVSSVAGHEAYAGGAVYCATKHAVEAMSSALLKELVATPLRVTSIAPGAVETEFSLVRFDGDSAQAKNVYEGFQPLTAEDIAEAILWVAERPPHVQVSQMIILATNQAGATTVHRN